MSRNLQDFPSGPLDGYRKKASFDWKKLKVYLYTEEVLEYQHKLYEELRQHSVFSNKRFESPTLEEERKITAQRMSLLNKLESCQLTSDFLANPRLSSTKLKLLIQWDPSACIKNSISFGMFPSVINGLGTERHLQYLAVSFDGDMVGAYCLTEIGHGSNAKNMQTTATYDKNTKEFVLHSPNFEAAKCWAGNLGQMATHAIVYAQLITPDGINHSLHPFIVKIRNPQTLLPYPGVIVGDMGEKIGLNGVDNGFVMFSQYRIPRTDLLNKTGDVAEDGTYLTPFKDPNKRYGASLGALSVGRVMITGICATYAVKAVTIAIRYAAVRKQFGPDGGDEIPILEYQSHQHRLMPYLSVAYVFELFSEYIGMIQMKLAIESMLRSKGSSAELGLELHAISSACKPLAGWLVRDGVQECREACAGHGYLKASRLGDIRDSNDANCTYEGENHVLIQQTSNWLLRFWPLILEGEKIEFPLQSVNFLTNALQILKRRFELNSVEDVVKPDNIIKMYQWLVCFLLKASHEKYESLMQVQKLDSFSARNESQVYYLKTLAIVYIQHFIIQRIYVIASEAPDIQCKNVLMKILSLYGVWTLEKYLLIFYEGGYASGPKLIELIRTAVLNLCKELKDDAVALIDVIAPPDFLLNSVLGNSDGMVYKHLEDAMLNKPGALSRPNWWNEIPKWKSKL